MFKSRRYIKPRVDKTKTGFLHLLDEATLLAEALILQHSGTRIERFKSFGVKRASINELNAVLVTMKSFVKKNLHYLDDTIDNLREESLKRIKQNTDFTRVIIRTMNMNLIADNNDISLYLAPFVIYWDLLTCGVHALILNQIIKNINLEIQRVDIASKISKKLEEQ